MNKETTISIMEMLFKEFDTNPNKLSNEIGVTSQSIYDVVNPKKQNVGISKRLAKKIADKFPVNESYFLTGSGPMLKSTHEINNAEAVIAENQEQYEAAIAKGLKMIPEVDFTFSAGPDIILNNETITRYWYLPDCEDCDVIVPMAGTSMLPMFPPGCELALKKYGFDPQNPNSIPFGNAFAVVIEDMVTNTYHGHIKILRRYKDEEMGKRFWIARSVNEEFDDFDIDIKTVRGVWIVKQHVIKDVIL